MLTWDDPLPSTPPRSIDEAAAWVRARGTSIWPAEVGVGEDFLPRLDGTSVLLSRPEGTYVVAFYERGAYRQAVLWRDEAAAAEDFVRLAQTGSGRRDGGASLSTWRPGEQPPADSSGR